MSEPKWWQQCVFYQIYPRSFADGNGDGIGDFQGIIAKLDYLRDLGIGAIWLSPHFPSPFLDCGYDISNYVEVAPEYGNLDDFKVFLAEAHARNIRVIIDWVLNHTSDQHEWFKESRSSRDNPKRDWYIWQDGQKGDYPNNWASIFGGSAWKYDSETDQYYYHAFLAEQPDLNWRNPEVKQAMWEAVRFWLDLGVDGLRLDAVATVFEDPTFPNQSLVASADEIVDANALDPISYRQLLKYQLKQPGLHELLQELRALLDEYPGDRMMVGEDDDVTFHGPDNNELHLVYNFPLLTTNRLTPEHVRNNQSIRLSSLPTGAWPCNTLGNHDSSRMWSRFGDGQYDAELARLHIALLLTLKGTPFLYYGEEIGMTDFQMTDLSMVRDTSVLNMYRRMTEQLGATERDALDKLASSTRDRCRTPMQWDQTVNSGFSTENGRPWLPINPNYAEGINVAVQETDPSSLLNFYRRLIHLRQSTPALSVGDYQALEPNNSSCLAFIRQGVDDEHDCLVILNFSEHEQFLSLEPNDAHAMILFSSHCRIADKISLDGIHLAPFEILIAQL